MENRRVTIAELSSHVLQISRSLLHEIVTEHLFRKLCARWVPKQLTPEHKTKRMESALTFLQQYYDDGDQFLDRIVTALKGQEECSGGHIKVTQKGTFSCVLFLEPYDAAEGLEAKKCPDKGY
ncbi:uncharacterized protein LOC111873645 [Cryptotermes secundus]|uniref:uncharacterized protein LOC111873645 n=1 Tax=Cryptotermes secundus TaxID=105785 RepID=UPI000CD7D184|nr:uncharacterized protein LOC111873645 [Cryptotermes secundus]